MADIVTKNDAFFSELLSPTAAKWSAGVAFDRSNGLPLDQWSVFQTKAKAEEYLTSAKAYPGQVIAYAETSGEMTVCVLSQNAAGTGLELKPVGVIPTAGDKIVVNGDVISHEQVKYYGALASATSWDIGEESPDHVVRIFYDESTEVVVPVALVINSTVDGDLPGLSDLIDSGRCEEGGQCYHEYRLPNIDSGATFTLIYHIEGSGMPLHYDYITEIVTDGFGHVIGYLGNNLPEDQDTTYTADNKTITISGDENTVSLFGSATAATGTLPMLEEVDGKQQLVWKTLEDIGAGDGNDNTTYTFEDVTNSEGEVVAVKVKVFENGVENTEKEFTFDPEFYSKKEADAKFQPVGDYKTTQEAKAFTGSTVKTITGVTQNANGEVDITFGEIAFPEDKDTTYSVKENDKVLKLTGTEFSTELGLKHENGKISLTGINGEVIAEFSDAEFVADGVLEDVSYDATKKELTFTWNVIDETTGEKKTDTVNIADLIDTYTAGKGLNLNGSEFEVKIASDSETFLTVDANGVKLSGVQDAIDAAKEGAEETAANLVIAAIADIDNNKLPLKADASSVYTKTEANSLLNAKANAADVYTQSEVNNLLNAKANNGTVNAIAQRVQAIEEAPYATEEHVANALTDYTSTDELTELLHEKADADEVAETYATKEYVGTIPTEATATDVVGYAQEIAGSSSAAVAQELNDYKEENAPKFEKLEGIEAGAQVNVIETVKVNGTALSVSDKAVDITVPTDVKELTDADKKFLTNARMKEAGDGYTPVLQVSKVGAEAVIDDSALQATIAGIKSTADTAVQSAEFAGKALTKTGTKVYITKEEAVEALGLKALAFTESIDTGVHSVSLASGTDNGTIKLTVDGTATDNIKVTGLGSAAYTESTAYDAAGSAAAILGTSTDAAGAATVHGALNKAAAILGTENDGATAKTVHGAHAAVTALANGAVKTNTEAIADLEERIGNVTNIMNFRGVVAHKEGNTLSQDVAEAGIGNLENGDVIIYGEKEYVYNGGAWYEFGDASGNANAITALTNRVEIIEGWKPGLASDAAAGLVKGTGETGVHIEAGEIKTVSTDLLVNGTLELIFCAGNASGYITD